MVDIVTSEIRFIKLQKTLLERLAKEIVVALNENNIEVNSKELSQLSLDGYNIISSDKLHLTIEYFRKDRGLTTPLPIRISVYSKEAHPIILPIISTFSEKRKKHFKVTYSKEFKG